jgi:hypothetical protein
MELLPVPRVLVMEAALLQPAEDFGRPTTAPRELLLPCRERSAGKFPLNGVPAWPPAAAAGCFDSTVAGSSMPVKSQLESRLVQLLLLLALLPPKQAPKCSPSWLVLRVISAAAPSLDIACLPFPATAPAAAA